MLQIPDELSNTAARRQKLEEEIDFPPVVLTLLVVVVTVLFGFVSSAYAATATSSSGLVIVIRQAAELDVMADSVTVRVRLARGVTAAVWADTHCSSSAPGAVVINRSGTYTVSRSQIGTAPSVCLLSSDGELKREATVNTSVANLNSQITSAVPRPR